MGQQSATWKRGNTNVDLARNILIEQYRFLRFQPIQPKLKDHPFVYLTYAILAALLAGVGRHWDKPEALLFDKIGLSSVVYIFVLGTILWIFAKPLKPENWSLLSIYVFMGFCSPCAYIYAIPVEMVMDFWPSVGVNLVLLLIVSIWRLVLFFHHLTRVGKLKRSRAFAAMALPISIAVIALAYLGLTFAALAGMSGIPEEELGTDLFANVLVLLLLVFPAIGCGLAALVVYIGALIEIFGQGNDASVSSEK